MTPETARRRLNAYIDGELDAASTIELESDIEASPALRQELERLSALHHVVQTRAIRFNAPSRLSKSLFATFSATKAESVPLGVSAWWRTIAIGTAASAVALFLWSLGLTFLGRDTPGVVMDEVVTAHVRSLMADHLTDLASSERHSVKPWLSNRLDFAPPVNEFASEGFVLAGARLDYIAGKPAAAIVYRYRQHLINVFVQPAPVSGDGSIKLSSHRGYNSVSFESNGMSYRAVSDLNQHDLGQLAKLLERESVMK
jgi:anti-sigma factor RsiW